LRLQTLMISKRAGSILDFFTKKVKGTTTSVSTEEIELTEASTICQKIMMNLKTNVNFLVILINHRIQINKQQIYLYLIDVLTSK
jgi:hypothetical protein